MESQTSPPGNEGDGPDARRSISFAGLHLAAHPLGFAKNTQQIST